MCIKTKNAYKSQDVPLFLNRTTYFVYSHFGGSYETYWIFSSVTSASLSTCRDRSESDYPFPLRYRQAPCTKEPMANFRILHSHASVSWRSPRRSARYVAFPTQNQAHPLLYSRSPCSYTSYRFLGGLSYHDNSSVTLLF